MKVYIARLQPDNIKSRIWVMFDKEHTLRGNSELSRDDVKRRWEKNFGPLTESPILLANSHTEGQLAAAMEERRAADAPHTPHPSGGYTKHDLRSV